MSNGCAEKIEQLGTSCSRVFFGAIQRRQTHPARDRRIGAGRNLVRRLLPFQANIRKRLVKRPKLFWRDSGLLHSQLNVTSRDVLLSHPAAGASWEGFVIEQILGSLAAAGRRFEAYYFGTGDQHEIDLVIEIDGGIWAFEIKLTSAPKSEDLTKLKELGKMIGAERIYLVSTVAQSTGDVNAASCNLDGVLERIRI